MSQTNQSTVEQATQHLIDQWRTLDPLRFASSFAADAEFTDVVGNTARGQTAIAELHVMPFTKLFRNAVIDVEEMPIRFVTPDVACVNIHWTMRGHTSFQGEALPPRRGMLHLVVARRDGRWQPVVAHNTDHTAVYGRGASEASTAADH
ncbi:SgcJ/EcaC family oxidoreductase [Deinococcus hopiensis]|uniref:SnoaL-like domain-containing protein n=1 Tax=Deinococcus hopiensis KR-140 TaxID=695939 RepID=A0A1W1UPY9_9DEIO|nr:SgcJ/EcaC family oxidoreductase [Deinococcus hopiensis]SMB83130.1 conserved hypothetical protein [Deinococcus hopiensis KR-140]